MRPLFRGQSQLLRYTLCVARCRKNVVSKQLTLYDQETTDQYVVDCEVLTVEINRVALVYHLWRNIALLP